MKRCLATRSGGARAGRVYIYGDDISQQSLWELTSPMTGLVPSGGPNHQARARPRSFHFRLDGALSVFRSTRTASSRKILKWSPYLSPASGSVAAAPRGASASNVMRSGTGKGFVSMLAGGGWLSWLIRQSEYDQDRLTALLAKWKTRTKVASNTTAVADDLCPGKVSRRLRADEMRLAMGRLISRARIKVSPSVRGSVCSPLALAVYALSAPLVLVVCQCSGAVLQ